MKQSHFLFMFYVVVCFQAPSSADSKVKVKGILNASGLFEFQSAEELKEVVEPGTFSSWKLAA